MYVSFLYFYVIDSLIERTKDLQEYSMDNERSIVDSKLTAYLDRRVFAKDELAYYDPDIHIPLNG